MKEKGNNTKLLASIEVKTVDGESLPKALVLRDQVLEEEPLGVDEEQETDVSVFTALDQEGEASLFRKARDANIRDLGVETEGGNVEAAGIESDADPFREAEQKQKVLNQLQGLTNLKKLVQPLSWGNPLDQGNKKKHNLDQVLIRKRKGKKNHKKDADQRNTKRDPRPRLQDRQDQVHSLEVRALRNSQCRKPVHCP